MATNNTDTAPHVAAPKKSANRNLAERVGTAVVLLPLVLWLMWLGGLPFACLIAAAAAVNAVEFCAMALKEDALRVPASLAAFAMPFFFIVPELGADKLHWLWSALVVIALTWRLLRDAPVESAGRDVSFTVFGGIYAALLGYMVPLRQLGEEHTWEGAGWVILAAALTWVGDTSAYFAGRFLGKNKLYPRISPAKTWEGFFGGMAGAIGAAFVVRWLLLPQLTAIDALALGVLGGIAGPIGDLVESMLKRAFSIKDSGNILPGHGGMLDRVDALMFNAPVVYLYAKLFVVS